MLRYWGPMSLAVLLGRRLSMSATPSLMVCSIGNPEPEYQGTRHNVGHLILDHMVANLKFTAFNKHRNLVKGVYSVPTNLEWDKIFLFKSNESLMNLQGHWVNKNWQLFSRSQPHPHLIIIHDDIQLPLGKVQVRVQGTSARGHNGLRSIDDVIGKTYTKISIGIGKPPNEHVISYVLGKFKHLEQDILQYDVTSQVIDMLKLMRSGKYINH